MATTMSYFSAEERASISRQIDQEVKEADMDMKRRGQLVLNGMVHLLKDHPLVEGSLLREPDREISAKFFGALKEYEYDELKDNLDSDAEFDPLVWQWLENKGKVSSVKIKRLSKVHYTCKRTLTDEDKEGIVQRSINGVSSIVKGDMDAPKTKTAPPPRVKGDKLQPARGKKRKAEDESALPVAGSPEPPSKRARTDTSTSSQEDATDKTSEITNNREGSKSRTSSSSPAATVPQQSNSFGIPSNNLKRKREADAEHTEEQAPLIKRHARTKNVTQHPHREIIWDSVFEEWTYDLTPYSNLESSKTGLESNASPHSPSGSDSGGLHEGGIISSRGLVEADEASSLLVLGGENDDEDTAEEDTNSAEDFSFELEEAMQETAPKTLTAMRRQVQLSPDGYYDDEVQPAREKTGDGALFRFDHKQAMQLTAAKTRASTQEQATLERSSTEANEGNTTSSLASNVEADTPNTRSKVRSKRVSTKGKGKADQGEVNSGVTEGGEKRGHMKKDGDDEEVQAPETEDEDTEDFTFDLDEAMRKTAPDTWADMRHQLVMDRAESRRRVGAKPRENWVKVKMSLGRKVIWAEWVRKSKLKSMKGPFQVVAEDEA